MILVAEADGWSWTVLELIVWGTSVGVGGRCGCSLVIETVLELELELVVHGVLVGGGDGGVETLLDNEWL